MIMVVITVGFLYAALETTGDLGSGITVLFFYGAVQMWTEVGFHLERVRALPSSVGVVLRPVGDRRCVRFCAPAVDPLPNALPPPSVTVRPCCVRVTARYCARPALRRAAYLSRTTVRARLAPCGLTRRRSGACARTRLVVLSQPRARPAFSACRVALLTLCTLRRRHGPSSPPCSLCQPFAPSSASALHVCRILTRCLVTPARRRSLLCSPWATHTVFQGVVRPIGTTQLPFIAPVPPTS